MMSDLSGENPKRELASLDRLLTEVSGTTAMPSDDLMARVLADAAVEQANLLFRVHEPQGSLWSQIGAAIGGWPALGGLAAAGVAGLWIGIAPPSAVETFAADLLGTNETVDVIGDGFTAIFEDANDG